MKAYKGFNSDMTCNDFQYKEGETYKEKEAQLCKTGFHACEDPLDCLSYYEPSTSEYHEVELEDVSPGRSEDSKVCAKKIKIGAKLSLSDMVKASINFRWLKTTIEKRVATSDRGAASVTGNRSAASATGLCGAASVTGYRSAASATGDGSAASATGNSSAASVTGDGGAASATGYRSAASATGLCGAASATGYRSAASATGYRGAASATGDGSAASATGNRSAASATGLCGAASVTGYRSAASATGKAGIALAAGIECKAMGALGCWIVLAEREFDENGCCYRIKEVKAFEVDGKTIMPGKWYILKDGKPKEVK